MSNFEKLQEHVFVTKLAGFEHTKYIQKSETHEKVNEDDIPLVQGKNIRNGFFVSKYDWYIRKEISDMLKRSKLDKPCILIPYVGSNLGEVGIFYHECDCHMASNIAKVELIDDYFDIEFLKYYLQSDIGQAYLFQAKQGSAQPNITMEAIRNTQVVDLDITLQRKVAAVLKSIDDKIINNRKINVELELMAKTIYDYWFLQFDYPDENGKPYKSSGGKMIWNEELKKEIPEGWSTGTLCRYIAKDKGGDWGKEVKEGNYSKRVICLRGADFPSITGKAELVAPVRYILEKNMCKILENGDLLIEISGGSPTQSTGRICYINNNLLERFDTDIVTSNFCKAISLNESNYMYWFYIQWLKIYDNNVLFKYEGKTTGIKNFLFDIFVNDYKIAAPPTELIIQYNNMVCVMFEEIQKKQKESQELASLRDFLLPLLMNGQVGFK